MNQHHRHLPKQVDAFKLAQQGIILEGGLAVTELPRLLEVLCNSSAVIHSQLAFGIDDEGHRTVKGQLRANLSITCNRCLEPMDYQVKSDIHWGLVATDEAAKALPAYLDPVMLAPDSSYVDLYEMLEDELLLSLPITAFHDHCEGAGSTRSFGEIDIDDTSASKKSFAALVDLKVKLKDDLKK